MVLSCLALLHGGHTNKKVPYSFDELYSFSKGGGTFEPIAPCNFQSLPTPLGFLSTHFFKFKQTPQGGKDTKMKGIELACYWLRGQ